MHTADAQARGVIDGSYVTLTSRVGETTMKVEINDRVPPGVVYSTFHYPTSGANVVTTEYSDWATNCPEYKVTAVEVRRTNHYSTWQERNLEEDKIMRRIAVAHVDAAE